MGRSSFLFLGMIPADIGAVMPDESDAGQTEISRVIVAFNHVLSSVSPLIPSFRRALCRNENAGDMIDVSHTQMVIDTTDDIQIRFRDSPYFRLAATERASF